MGCHVISPGELATGQHVTVLEHRPQGSDRFADSVESIMNQRRPECDWKGVLFEVVAVDIPFVLLKPIEDDSGSKVLLDTRSYIFKELSAEFVQAASREQPKPESHPQFGELARAHNNLARISGEMQKKLDAHLSAAPVATPAPKPKRERLHFGDYVQAFCFAIVIYGAVVLAQQIFR